MADEEFKIRVAERYLGKFYQGPTLQHAEARAKELIQDVEEEYRMMTALHPDDTKEQKRIFDAWAIQMM